MMMPVNHHDWQVLRIVLRASGKGVAGRLLRITPTRRTKDGSFLTKLVERNLLKVSKAGETPFDEEYKLTPGGKYAAEYGEYESVNIDGVASLNS